uniref:ARAD1D00902p n=1 Tax=Blastobotrys adeninivorans TaxID=409370 RepID=A0A060TCN0_BLAAD
MMSAAAEDRLSGGPNLSSTPQALRTGFASRLRLDQTSLFVSTHPTTRSNRRATVNAIQSYAELDDDFDDDDDETYSDTGIPGTPMGMIDRPSVAPPAERKTEVKKAASKTRHATYSQKQLNDIANKEELLVPIRLNLEYDNHRLTDFFMWNINEEVITPEAFAMITCTDLDLPVGFTQNIVQAIRNGVAEYSEAAAIKLPPDTGLHVVIQLNVNLDKQVYEDKFEWDLSTDDLTAEEFARTVVADLGLAGEFYPAIAHALHEALLRIKHDARDGHLPQEVENFAAFSAEAGRRVDQELLGEEWAPTVEVLSQEEIERREIERDRNMRRLKRESARMSEQVTDIGGLFGRSKRRRRYDDLETSRGGSPAYW